MAKTLEVGVLGIPFMAQSWDSRKDFFLVGSDYVFPRTANEIIRNQLAALGGSTVGEMYLPLGEKSNASVGAIINEIQRTCQERG